MAPRPPSSKLHFIRDMIESHLFSTFQLAEEAECGKLTIINIHRNLRQFRPHPPNVNRPEANCGAGSELWKRR
ncbi:unnamed protein product [Penicillium camemberti]|uniref:Str. FM013 n=1 Tax=Penicillium camemberti (strain FM 013) TaxID=1429867 RepID=A0A0G4NZK0_PENC3|nr:unnamed protein product [Penicillium camemberti]